MIFNHDIGAHCQPENGEENIRGLHAGLSLAQPGRVEKVHEDEDEPEVDGALDLGFKDPEGRSVELEQGEKYAYRFD